MAKFEWNKLCAIIIIGLGSTYLAGSGQVGGDAVLVLYGVILGYLFKNGKDLIAAK